MTPEQALTNLIAASQQALMTAVNHNMCAQSAQCLDAFLKSISTAAGEAPKPE